MGATTQNIPPQAPVISLPMSRKANAETPAAMNTQPRMNAGTRDIIVHFRPILSTRNGTTGIPRAAPSGKTDAITFVENASKRCSSFKSSTHGALHPRPQPNENPPMHAARPTRTR